MWQANRKKFTIVAVILIPIVLTLVVILAVTLPTKLSDKKFKNDTSDVETTTVDSNFDNRTCNETISSYLLSHMDLKTQPCENFYQYACGNWEERNTTLSPVQKVREKFYEDFIEKLERNSFIIGDSKFIKGFWESCTNRTEPNTDYFSDLLSRYLHLETPNLVSNIQFGEYFFDWMQKIGILKAMTNGDVFFSFKITHNLDRTKYIMQFNSPPVKPNSFLSHNSDLVSEILMSEEVSKLMKMFSYSTDLVDDEELEPNVKLAFKLENELTELIVKFRNDGDKEMKCTSVSEFTESLNSTLQMKGNGVADLFDRFFNGVFRSVESIKYQEHDVCYNLNTIRYLSNLISWFLKLPKQEIELLVWYKAIREVEPYIYFNKTSPTSAVPTREKQCAVLIYQCLGDLLAVEEVFPREHYSSIKKIVENIVDSFIDTVKNAKWIDTNTRRLILDKIMNRLDILGYPENAYNITAIEEYVSQLKILPHEKEYLISYVFNSIKTRNQYIFKKLGTNYEGPWPIADTMFPLDITFLQNANALMIHNVLMQFPLLFLDSNADINVVNYGLFGSVVGSSLLEGINSEGMNYNKFGFPVDDNSEWSTTNETNFSEKKKCFVQLYDTYTAYGENFTSAGEQTFDVNVGDNAGLYVSYKAYQKSAQKSRCVFPEQEEYDDDQLFFIAFANYYCEKEPESTSDYFKEYEKSKTPPSVVRVNNALKNSEYFAKAFSCPLGSEMNPEDMEKCIIW